MTKKKPSFTSYSPLVRILIRYIVGALVAQGTISASAGELLTNPEVLTALVAILIGIGTELWYRASKKKGGAT